MPKRVAGLTDVKVRSHQTPGMLADGHGLYLQVANGGSKSWIFRFQINGRRRDLGLGSLAKVPLKIARRKAKAALELVADGIDPIEHKNAAGSAAAVAQAKAVTFKQAATAYIDHKRAGWRNAKHASQWSSTLETYVFPVFGHLPVSAVDTALVCKALDPIWRSKTETASRVRGRIESILDHAKVRGLREGENPARWHGHLKLTYAAKGEIAPVRHHSSLPYSELPAFWPRLQLQDGMGARALEFAILTAGRTGEILGARWSEIDLDARVWRIPGKRMKAGKEHAVPLSVPAVALLQKLAAVRTSDIVFQGHSAGTPLTLMAPLMTLRRLKVAATPHGFRSTFRTWVAEQTNFPHEVAEAALAHTQGDKVVAAYLRSDFAKKRVALMDAWARFVVGNSSVANVVSIGRR